MKCPRTIAGRSFPTHSQGASIPRQTLKEVPGVALMVARAVPDKIGPTTSSMAVPHGPASVGTARRRMRRELGDRGIPDAVVDDAVLILSELLSNSCRYARPLGKLTELDGDTDGGGGYDGVRGNGAAARGTRHDPYGGPGEPEPGGILVRWWTSEDGPLTLAVTDGGAVTRPMPAAPSLTARGGRGLSIVGKLSCAWGVRDAPGEVTVWAAVALRTDKGDDLAGGPGA
jgi:hypothetical protein